MGRRALPGATTALVVIEALSSFPSALPPRGAAAFRPLAGRALPATRTAGTAPAALDPLHLVGPQASPFARLQLPENDRSEADPHQALHRVSHRLEQTAHLAFAALAHGES